MEEVDDLEWHAVDGRPEVEHESAGFRRRVDDSDVEEDASQHAEQAGHSWPTDERGDENRALEFDVRGQRRNDAVDVVRAHGIGEGCRPKCG